MAKNNQVRDEAAGDENDVENLAREREAAHQSYIEESYARKARDSMDKISGGMVPAFVGFVDPEDPNRQVNVVLYENDRDALLSPVMKVLKSRVKR